MTAHEFAVTIGMDALRLSTGLKPKTHSVETILRWLAVMAALSPSCGNESMGEK